MRARLDGREAVLLRVEHARRAAVQAALVARELHHRALGREVAAQDARPPVAFSGGSIGTMTSWPGVSSRRRAISPRVRPSTFGVAVSRPAPLHELAGHERDAAGRVEVGGDEATARLELATIGVRVAMASKSSSRSGMPELPGDRQQVEDAVRRAAASRRSPRWRCRSTRA